jgi:cobalt-zinc-cadmium efflux system outer membrane protein
MDNRVLLQVAFSVVFSISILAQPADTIKLSLEKAEKQFVDSNLLLIAAKYNIDEKAALTAQAKIWDLPNITFTHGAYQTITKKWFSGQNSGSIDHLGEMSVQVQQLIQIVGKRSNLVKMAEVNNQIATYQFYDVLRNLKYQLHQDFYDLYFKQKSLEVFRLEISMLDDIVPKYEKLYTDGDVSMRDVLRIKSLLLSLKSEQLELIKDINETQAELRVLLKLKTNSYLIPTDKFDPDTVYVNHLTIAALIDTALINRPDLLAVNSSINLGKYDLKYQKSLAIPNIQLIAGWDMNASYIHNYNYAGIAIDLPLWNKNKGNIRAASARFSESNAEYENFSKTVENEVISRVMEAQQTNKVYLGFNHKFLREFNTLVQGANESFSKHEINLLEFIDLYETFKESEVQNNTLQFNCLMGKENINYCVGKEIFK